MKKSYLFTALIVSLSVVHFSAYAHGDGDIRPDGHAPIGVKRDHIHHQGKLMASYRYAVMKMEGMRDGSDRVSSAKVAQKYMMAPSNMDMKMHMLGGMYGVTDNVTIAAMGSFVEKEMRMSNRMQKVIDREVSGFGDSKLNLMYRVLHRNDSHVQFNLGMSIPTGSIKENHQGNRLAYPMQLGSGSYEALPGVSYSGFKDDYSYGTQLNGTFRLDDNNSGYRLGDSYNVTAWAAKKLNQAVSVSSRLNYTMTQKIKGADETLMVAMSPANDTASYAGRSLQFLLGTNFIVPKGALKGHRLAIEGGMPLYQSFNGMRLESDYIVTVGWQKAF